MLDRHAHQWKIRREWKDPAGRWLPHRTCDSCTLVQQVRYVYAEMIWTLFRLWDRFNQEPVFDRKRHYVRVIS